MDGIMAWAGGKSRLRSRIIERIPEHERYVEPCMGAAWVFFGKGRSREEVLSDLDEELVNLFRVIQGDPEAFAAGIEYLLVSRRQYSLFKARDPRSLCPAARAVRFYYLIQLGFGAKRTQMTFGTGATRRPPFSPRRVRRKVLEASRRLEGVSIAHRKAVETISAEDSPGTFFFVDPPYHDVTQPYAHTMDAAGHRRLRDALAGVEGRFLLTINDHPYIRELYDGFEVDELPTRYSLPTKDGARGRRHSTLLVGNFPHRR